MERLSKPFFYGSSEMDECRAYWKWAQHNPTLRNYLYKIVNEGKRSPIHGRHLTQIGLRKGVPDYHLPVPNDSYNGFWLEMKTKEKGRYKISPYQAEWMDKLRLVGQYATFGYGWEDASEKTLAYLNNKL